MTNTQAAVIDFGTSKVVTIIAKGNERKTERLEIIGTGSVLYDGFRDGDWNTPEKLVDSVKNSIAAAELQARQNIHEVYVGVPGEYIRVYSGQAEVEVTGPNQTVCAEDLDRLQDAVAEQLHLIDEDGIVLHRSPAWFSVDDGPVTLTPINEEETGRTKLEGCISFVLADRQFMNDIAELMGMLNITVAGYFSSTLGEALLMVPQRDRDNVSVMIDTGYLNTEISLVQGDAIVQHTTVDIGGSELVVALADALRVDLKEAERIKRGFSFQPDEYEEQEDVEIRDPYSGRRKFIPRYEVADAILPAMNDIVDAIVEAMNQENIFAQLSQNSKIFLTGGGIGMMKGARAMLSEIIQNPIESVTNKTGKLNYPMFSSALGLTSLVFDALQEDKVPEEKASWFPKFRFGK